MEKKMEKKIKHLEMIEAIIERMAKNSLQLKEWTMALVVLVATITSQSGNENLVLLGFVPIIGFWFLDSFYLLQERKYKVLYKNVSKKEEDKIDFNLDTNVDVNGEERNKNERLCMYNCIFSTSEILFYPIIAICLTILFIVLKNSK